MKPKILLHTCCAPCASAVVEYLKPNYEVVLFFAESNIWPKEEFEKRRDELLRWAKKEGIEGMVIDYDHEKWLVDVARGNEVDLEGGKRCEKCFRWRLERVAEKAKELEIGIIGTTLSISPHKNSEKVNEALREVAQKYGLKVMDEDWGRLFGRSCELSKELDFYRQNYCGCEYSKRGK